MFTKELFSTHIHGSVNHDWRTSQFCDRMAISDTQGAVQNQIRCVTGDIDAATVCHGAYANYQDKALTKHIESPELITITSRCYV
jgi:hypothetical protein